MYKYMNEMSINTAMFLNVQPQSELSIRKELGNGNCQTSINLAENIWQKYKLGKSWMTQTNKRTNLIQVNPKVEKLPLDQISPET